MSNLNNSNNKRASLNTHTDSTSSTLLSVGNAANYRRKSEMSHNSNATQFENNNKQETNVGNVKRPSVSALIHKFDTTLSISQPVIAPLPRRKSQSHKDLPSPIGSPTSSQTQLAMSAKDFIQKSATSPHDNVESLSQKDLRSLTMESSMLFDSETTGPLSETKSDVSILLNDGTVANKPPPDIELKPKPVFRKSMQSIHNLARSNATNKKRSSMPVSSISTGTLKRLAKLEFAYNQYDIYLLFKLIGQLGPMIADLQQKYDDSIYQSLSYLIGDFTKFISSCFANEPPGSNPEKWIASMKKSFEDKDYTVLKKCVLLCVSEYQKKQNLIPIQTVPTFKIEACSLAALNYQYTRESSEDNHALASLLSNINPKYMTNIDGTHDSYADIIKYSDQNLPIIPLDCFDSGVMCYRKCFRGLDHRNVFGYHEKYGEFVFSIKREKPDDNAGSFRVLFRCKNVSRLFHMLIPENDVSFAKSSNDLSDKMLRYIMNMVIPKIDVSKLRKYEHVESNPDQQKIDGSPSTNSSSSINLEKVEKSVMQLDEHKLSFQYKFGLLYITQSQVNEVQWFNNVLHIGDSKSFDNFCNVLGDFIELKGHSGFTGGLDTKNGMTGEYSLYTRCRYDTKTHEIDSSFRVNSSKEQISRSSDETEFEIMYHVSTLLPYTEGDEQQIQRKRHIGNDLVCLVFIDKDGNCTTPIPGQPNTEGTLLLPKSNARRSGTIDSMRSASTILSQESTSTMDSLNISSRKEQKPTNLCVDALFDPRTIRSQFLHVYVVVQEVLIDPTVISHVFTTANLAQKHYNSNQSDLIPAYRVYTTSLLDVPNFSPSMPDPPIFPIVTDQDKLNVRNFILSKLINAENAAFQSNKFKSLHGRTYLGLIESLWKEYGENQDLKAHKLNDDIDIKATLSTMLGRRSSSRPKSSFSSSSQSSIPAVPSSTVNTIGSNNTVPNSVDSSLNSPANSAKNPSSTIMEHSQTRRDSSDSIKKSSIAVSKHSPKLSAAARTRPSSAGVHESKSSEVSFLEFLNNDHGDQEQEGEKNKDGLLGKLLKRKESLKGPEDGIILTEEPKESKSTRSAGRKNRLSMNADDLVEKSASVMDQ